MFQCIDVVRMVGVSLNDIRHCALGPEGFYLMMVQELETVEKTKGQFYEPTVVFDDVSGYFFLKIKH